jgi:hypothetical protein
VGDKLTVAVVHSALAVPTTTLSAAYERSHEEEKIRRTFSHPTCQIWVPRLAVRKIHTHLVPHGHKFGLTISANAIEHLELPRLVPMLCGGEDLLKARVIMTRDRDVYSGRLHQYGPEPVKRRINLIAGLVCDSHRLGIGTLAQSNMTTERDEPVEVICGPPEVGLDSDPEIAMRFLCGGI